MIASDNVEDECGTIQHESEDQGSIARNSLSPHQINSSHTKRSHTAVILVPGLVIISFHS